VAEVVKSTTSGLVCGHDQRLRGQPFLFLPAAAGGSGGAVHGAVAGASRGCHQPPVSPWRGMAQAVAPSAGKAGARRCGDPCAVSWRGIPRSYHESGPQPGRSPGGRAQLDGQLSAGRNQWRRLAGGDGSLRGPADVQLGCPGAECIRCRCSAETCLLARPADPWLPVSPHPPSPAERRRHTRVIPSPVASSASAPRPSRST
jgi:hypothetical protein